MGIWLEPILDVRTLLSDGPTDKLCWRKQVIGQLDGVNKAFKSFEFRRITPFVGAVAPNGVFVDDALVAVDSEDLGSGYFQIHTAPTNGQSLTATYYVQWFLDDEIEQFLTSATEWLGLGDDWLNIPPALRPAAKEYACAQAYQKLVARFSVNLAETYQLYDAPDRKRFDPIAAYMKIAESKMKLAFELRDDVYKNRQGQALAPLFGNNIGGVGAVTPKR